AHSHHLFLPTTRRPQRAGRGAGANAVVGARRGAGRRPALMCRVLSSPARSTCYSPRAACQANAKAAARQRRRGGRPPRRHQPHHRKPRASARRCGATCAGVGRARPHGRLLPRSGGPPRWPQRRGYPFARWFGGAGPWHPSHGVLWHVLERIQAACISSFPLPSCPRSPASFFSVVWCLLQ
ncbi:unnamed protein product, partial [Urochloa humidicola]